MSRGNEVLGFNKVDSEFEGLQSGQPMSAARPQYVLSTRSTFCDVTSIVTTVALVKNGKLKYAKPDILPDRRGGRLTPATGLYEEGVKFMNPDQLHARLKLERMTFMAGLSVKRQQQHNSFHIFAVKIQRNFRRHLVQKHWSSTRQSCLVRKQVRQLVQGKHHKAILVSWSKFIRKEKYWRKHAAERIQKAYRLYRKALIKREELALMEAHMNKMATKIQCLQRKSVAKHRTASLVLDKYFKRHTTIAKMGAFELSIIYRTNNTGLNVAASMIQRMVRNRKRRFTEEALREKARVYALRLDSATRIQALFRGSRARKWLRSLNARVIVLQCLVRSRLARARVRRIMTARKAEILRQRQAATLIQKTIRAKLARVRVSTMRHRLALYKVFYAASKIQSLVRGVLTRRSSQARALLRAAEEAAAAAERAREAVETDRIAQELAAFNAQVASDIFYQAKLGDAAAVDRLFNDMQAVPPRSISDVNDNNETILLVAASLGHLEIVQRCVWWGFNLNHRNKDDHTAIMVAVKGGHELVVNFLLDLPTVSSKDKYKPKTLVIKPQDTAIMTTAATRSGHGRLLKRLCDYGVIIDAKLSTTGESALQVACSICNIEAIRFLVGQRCNIMSADDKGVTALMKACMSSSQATRIMLGLSEESHVLLKRLDADAITMVLARDAEGKDCYIHAALHGRRDVLDVFHQLIVIVNKSVSVSSEDDALQSDEAQKMKRSTHWTQVDFLLIGRLIESGDTQCLGYLLEESLSASMVHEATGRTFPMLACEHGQLEILEMLMSRGINMSHVDREGHTWIHYAAKCSHTKVIQYVLQHLLASKTKALLTAINSTDKALNNPLHIAGRYGASVPMGMFPAEHVSQCLSSINGDRLTPLLEACKAQKATTVCDFIAHGAPVTSTDDYGNDGLWHLLYPHSLQRREFLDFGRAAVKLNKRGCSLYKNHAEHGASGRVYEPVQSSPHAGDFAVLVLDTAGLEALRELHKDTPAILWQLVRSAIMYEKESCYALKSLLNKEMLDLLGYSLFEGYSLLGWAVVHNNMAAMEFLLDSNFSVVEPVNSPGDLILHVAVRHNFLEAVRIIMNLGKGVIDVDALNKAGETALMVGARYGSYETVRLLHIRYGASARKALDGKYWAWLLALAIKEIIHTKG